MDLNIDPAQTGGALYTSRVKVKTVPLDLLVQHIPSVPRKLCRRNPGEMPWEAKDEPETPRPPRTPACDPHFWRGGCLVFSWVSLGLTWGMRSGYVLRGPAEIKPRPDLCRTLAGSVCSSAAVCPRLFCSAEFCV